MIKKSFFKHLIFTVISLFIMIFCNFLIVEATGNEENNNLLNEEEIVEEKIMKYDRLTNEITEVNMEELKGVLKTKSKGSEIYKTESYNPQTSHKYNIFYRLENINPFSATSAERIYDTSKFPNNVTCRIYVNDSSGEKGIGTAAIVGRDIAITSAHCVFDEDDGNAQFQNWTLYPGYNGGECQGSTATWTTAYYSSVWMDNHSYDYDWAVCVLDKDVGDEVGWNGVMSYGSSTALNGTDVTVLGYPADYKYGFDSNGIYQYKTGANIISVNDRRFEYTGLTFEGFSGGPIRRNVDNLIVGIHYGFVGAFSTTPVGTRITSDIVNIILDLQAQ